MEQNFIKKKKPTLKKGIELTCEQEKRLQE